MGLFDKIKSVFYDEEITEVPEEKVKREEVKPKIEKVERPLVEEEKPKPKLETPVYTEREIFKTESSASFKFPMIDEEEEKPKQRSRVNVLEERAKESSKRENKYADLFKEKSTPEKKPERIFKPSPVISPVYGVLDKNYTKEEIMERSQEVIPRTTSPKDMNYDAVRRKAYGTLEDELESTLTELSEPKHTEKPAEKADNKSIEDLLNEIEGNKNMSIGEIEEKIKDKMEEEESEPISLNKVSDTYSEEEESENDESGAYDKTLEHDLFNLIDSMYEEKEGE